MAEVPDDQCAGPVGDLGDGLGVGEIAGMVGDMAQRDDGGPVVDDGGDVLLR